MATKASIFFLRPASVFILNTRNLYNQRPAWLAIGHEALDEAVSAAYGWKDYSPQWTEEDILRRLLALNLERVTEQISAKG